MATSSAVLADGPAILAVGLAKVRCAETEKISQRAWKVFVLQREEFLTGSQATLRFHSISVLHCDGEFKAGNDEFAQARGGSVPSSRR